MKWQDTGICLYTKKFGESHYIVSFLTHEHGIYQGMLRARKNLHLCPGNLYHLSWSARLPEHMGTWQIELGQDHLARVYFDAKRLLGIASSCAMCRVFLPERMRNTLIYQQLQAIMDNIADDRWVDTYVSFEAALLRDQGYILNWNECAKTKQKHNFGYVSPQSGNIVSVEGARGYEDRLIPWSQDQDNSPYQTLKIYQILFERLYLKNEAAPQLPTARATFIEALGCPTSPAA